MPTFYQVTFTWLLLIEIFMFHDVHPNYVKVTFAYVDDMVHDM